MWLASQNALTSELHLQPAVPGAHASPAFDVRDTLSPLDVGAVAVDATADDVTFVSVFGCVFVCVGVGVGVTPAVVVVGVGGGGAGVVEIVFVTVVVVALVLAVTVVVVVVVVLVFAVATVVVVVGVVPVCSAMFTSDAM